MSNNNNKDDASGCAAIVGLLLVLTLVLWLLSFIGHAIGLTPTFNEVTDSPDGWVSEHYKGVVMGYVLTIVLLLGLIAVVAFSVRVATRTGPVPKEEKDTLRGGWLVWGVIFVVAMVLPIGRKEAAPEPQQLATATSGPVQDGDKMPDLVGKTAAEADEQLGDDLLVFYANGEPEKKGKCRITSQTPAAGVAVSDTTRIDLKCAITIPSSVRGSTINAARKTLSARGLTTFITNRPASGKVGGCKVHRVSPARTASPMAIVDLTAKCAKRPKPKTKQQVIDDYIKQVQDDAPAADSDTADSSSSYAGMTCPEIGHSFTVPPGSDPEHDRDGDGLACESQ